MTHTIHRVRAFDRLGGFRMRVEFEDRTQQVIDFEPVLAGELYGPLRDPSLFEQVALDPEVHTLVWPNGADFDPETLHDWPKYAPALRERAQAWERTPTRG